MSASKDGLLAHFSVKIGIHESDQSCFEQAVPLAKSVRPDFSEQLEYQFFTEGYTNRVLSIWCQQKGPNDRVLVRIFGEKTELMIDRDAELQNLLKLNSIGCGARVYGTFENGLLYEFLPGTAMDCDQVADQRFSKLIAENLAKLHCQVVGDPLDSTQPFLIRKTESFLKELEGLSFEDPQKQQLFEQKFVKLEVLRSQFKKLVDDINQLKSPVVFCHNDLLPKNIVFDSTSGTVAFIDFEYADSNWQAYDIADHFCEFAGMDDFDPNRYPSKKFQQDWLTAYLTSFLQLRGQSQPPTDADVEQLFNAVNKCAAACDFFWGVWGIIQAKHSSIDFDYLQFAVQRMDQYKRRSQAFTFV